MAWAITVNGTPWTANVHQPSGVEIVLPQNERGTARFTSNPGFIPTLRSEVLIYDQDGTTVLFGGVVFQRTLRGQVGTNRSCFCECECADWTWYLDRITIPGGSINTPFITLKNTLEWLIANLLGPFGFTLHPSQVDGPAGPWQFAWERKYVSEILRDLSNASGGWLWSVNPLKQLRMIAPSLAIPTAPFTITDTNQRAHELRWMETSEQYATRVILRCGGEGTKESTETWTLTAPQAAAGFLVTTFHSTANGPISAKINGVEASIGPSGTNLIWDWATHTISVGSTPWTTGKVIEVTYTAQALETWTLTGADITRGYIQTTAPSTPLGPIRATVNGGFVTIGASGTQLIWTWSTHRISAGTLIPVAGDIIAAAYTAHYPFEVIEDSGISPPIEMVIDQPDLTDPATAKATAVGQLAQHLAAPRTFDLVTFAPGLRPGQVITINSAQSASASLAAMITEVRITLLTNQTWRYQATAVAGIYQGSSLDYFRSLGGVSTGSAILVTNAPTTTTLATAARTSYLLSTGLEFVQSVPPIWVAASVIKVTIDPATRPANTVIVMCQLRSLVAGVSCTARLRNLTDGTTVGTSSVVTSTAWTDANFSATLAAGTKVYQLQLLPGTANRDVGAVAYLE